jgi:hypothetical protein
LRVLSILTAKTFGIAESWAGEASSINGIPVRG